MRSRAVRGAVIACAALTSGCQSVMWYATDGSGARALSRCGEQFVVVRGREDRSFDAIGLETIAVGADGRVAYAAEEEKAWWVVVEGHRVGRAFDRVSGVAWSGKEGIAVAVVGDEDGDHLLAARRAERGTTWALGPGFKAIAKGSLTTNASGRFAFVGWDAEGARVAQGRLFDAWEVSAPFEGVASLTIAPDGAPSYVARRGDDVFVVRRGEASGPYEDVASLDVSADGSRGVALVHDEAGWRADDGAWVTEAYDRIGDVRIAARSNRVALRAKRGDDEYVVTDVGAAGAVTALGPYAAVVPKTLTIGGAEDRVAYAVEEADGVRVIDGGAPVGTPWTAVEAIVVGEDGRLGYVAKDGATVVVRVEETPHGAWRSLGDWSRVSELRLTPAGSVFVGHAKGRDAVVQDGEPRWFDQILAGTFALAPDGATWGAVAVVEDGLVLARREGGGEYVDLEGYFGEMLRRGEVDWDASGLRSWVKGRLSR